MPHLAVQKPCMPHPRCVARSGDMSPCVMFVIKQTMCCLSGVMLTLFGWFARMSSLHDLVTSDMRRQPARLTSTTRGSS